jgi:hypothetical protein
MRISSWLLAAGFFAAAGCTPQSGQSDRCENGHVCAIAQGHEFSTSKHGNSVSACLVTHLARAIEQPYALLVSMQTGEGEILSYVRIAIRAGRIDAATDAEGHINLRRARLVGVDRNIDTDSWDIQNQNGVIYFRTDVFPENRASVENLANVSMRDPYVVFAETDDGTKLNFVVALHRPSGDMKQRFLACSEDARLAAG